MNQVKKMNWGTDAPLETPYLNAKQEWDTRMGSTVTQAKNWRLAFFLMLLIVGVTVSALIYKLFTSNIEVHIVEIFENGTTKYAGRAGKNWNEYKPTDVQKIDSIQEFLDYTRTVSIDPAINKKNWLKAYNYLTARASKKLSEYVNQPGNNPFERSKKVRVALDDFTNVSQISENTWQVDWIETTWTLKGDSLGSQKWRANFTLSRIAPKNEKDIQKNHLGIFINDFHWSKTK